MIRKTLSDGSVVTALPLTIPQQFMLGCSLQYGKGYLINNIGSGYYFKADMDFEVMKQAVCEAVDRCETMRLRFVQDEQYKVLQYIQKKSQMEIETLDLHDLTADQADDELLNLTRGPVPMFECELHKIWMVKLPEGYNGLLMKFQHLAMDAYSVKIFLKDVMEIYLSKIKGTDYPKPMRPYFPEVAKELAYINSSKHDADRKYWYDSLATTTEPVFTDYLIDNRLKKQQKQYPDRRYCDIHSGSPDADVQQFSMSKEDSEKIVNMCIDRGLSVCAVLSMGLRTALSVFNDNQKDVSFKMIVNRRGSISEKKSGGIRINFFPMRSIINETATFTQAVEEIEKIQSEIYSHCSLSFMEMLALRHKSMPETALPDSTYDSVGFSYQPLMVIPNIDEETEKSARGVWYNNGASMIPLYLTVRHRAGDGGFEFVFEYRKVPEPKKDIEIFYKKLRSALIIGAGNADITVGEILKEIALDEDERK